MSIDQEGVSPGSEIAVRYEGLLAESHGGYFYVLNSAGERIAGLWIASDTVEEPGYTFDLDQFEILDYAVSGPGPDTLLIPAELTPGAYQLCTANSVPTTCAIINVT